MSRVSRLVAGAFAASALLLVGCIKESDEVTVKADGSGTYSENMSLDLSACKGVAEAMKKEMGGPAAMDGDKPAKEDKPDPLGEMKERVKGIEGLEVVSATADEKDGRLTMKAEVKFKTLEAYAKASGLEMS